MNKHTKPILEDGYVFDDSLPSLFSIKSEYFKEWLEKQRKFSVKFSHSQGQNYSCYKDNKNYWVAQKRVDSKLRSKRLGNSSRVSILTWEQFYDIGINLTRNYQTKDDYILKLEVRCLEFSDALGHQIEKSDNQTLILSRVGSVLLDGLMMDKPYDKDEAIRNAIALLDSLK